LTSERRTEEFVAGKGVVTRWDRVRRANHWFDALYNACIAAHWAGIRLMQPSHKRSGPIVLSELQKEKKYGVISKMVR
jgi:hypothetical protein